MDFTFQSVVVAVVLCGLVAAFASWRAKVTEVVVDRPPKTIAAPRAFSSQQLAACLGGTASEWPYVGVRGIVYRVSPQWYGPDAPYHAFAGRDSSRHLGKTTVGTEEANSGWTTLSRDHLSSLQEWEERFQSKYLPVGWMVLDDEFESRGLQLVP